MIKIIVFSDPEAIKRNHGVIYSGQSERWPRQPAAASGQRGLELGDLPRRGSDRHALRWVLGGCGHSPLSPPTPAAGLASLGRRGPARCGSHLLVCPEPGGEGRFRVARCLTHTWEGEAACGRWQRHTMSKRHYETRRESGLFSGLVQNKNFAPRVERKLFPWCPPVIVRIVHWTLILSQRLASPSQAAPPDPALPATLLTSWPRTRRRPPRGAGRPRLSSAVFAKCHHCSFSVNEHSVRCGEIK